MVFSCNLLTRAKEPGPAACGKPDSPRFSYVELTLILTFFCSYHFCMSSHIFVKLHCLLLLAPDRLLGAII
ncbi:hypothetical protein [Leptospira kirschneri]|uniref:hypothetical protein n=1 Tax=Leptospira kirschneri TaxID=29507 RepID=UPI0009E5DD46|nr:hypothetical protein [Leptospira kirschneri]